MKNYFKILTFYTVAIFVLILLAACPNPSDAHEHTWVDGLVFIAPGCGTAGIQQQICSGCGVGGALTAIAALELPHDWEPSSSSSLAPTCTEAGYGRLECKKCSAISVGDSIAPLGHDHNWIITTFPTETEDGIETNKCLRCTDIIGTRAVYATGTISLYYALIDNGTAYRVNGASLNLSEVVIPAFYRENEQNEYLPVTAIGDGAFMSGYETRNLSSITIPASVTSIGANAFDGCINLSDISLPAGLTSIGDYAFDSCRNLSNITIPASVTSIGQGALYVLNSIVVDTGNINYASEDGILYNKAKTVLIATPKEINSVIVPASVTSIGYSAFQDCNLSSITLPAGLISIGDYVFSNCSNLNSIVIPASVTSIGRSAFSSCNNLISITLPSGLTSIEVSMFQNCNNLSSITLPIGLTSIGGYAFSSCINLSNISLPAGLTSIGYNAFSGCQNLSSITIPASVTSIGEGALYALNSIVVDTGNINYASEDGILYNKAKTVLITAPKEINSVIVPASVTSIGYRAFENCNSLSSITLPVGLTSIGNYAFQNCNNLNNITLPVGLTSIGNGAFGWCNLISIILPVGLTSIGNSAFLVNDNLVSVSFNGNIPSSGFSTFSFYGDLRDKYCRA